MTEAERTEARACFGKFKRRVSFRGYRRAVWKRLNNYERAFALPVFFFGSALPLHRVYQLLHRKYQST